MCYSGVCLNTRGFVGVISCTRFLYFVCVCVCVVYCSVV